MQTDIRWIAAVYWLPDLLPHISVPQGGRAELKRMGQVLLGTAGHVGLYVPEGDDNTYIQGGNRGRIVGLVSLVEMPNGRRMEDYHYLDFDGSKRWPIGWPCKLVQRSAEGRGPKLREHVELLPRAVSFRVYVGGLHTMGLLELEGSMRESLNRDFAGI